MEHGKGYSSSENTDVETVPVEANASGEFGTTTVMDPVVGHQAFSLVRDSESVSSKLYRSVSVSVLLGMVIWIAHFWYSSQFGLYEDDWNRVPKTIGIDWHGLWSLLKVFSTLGRSEGRPFHPTFIFVFSFLGFKLGGLHAIYLIAFAIAVTNATLFYWFLKRVFIDEKFALLGSLAFCLFPADTTQSFLTHALGVQPSITFLLLALHCYISNWKKSSYAFIILTLFTYETMFPVFVVAPFLRRRPWLEVIRHCVVMFTILVSVFALRSVAAESRVSHLGLQELLLFLTNPVTGPLLTVFSYVYRPVSGLFGLSAREALALSVCCAGLAYVLAKVLGSEPPAPWQARKPNRSTPRPELIGLIMLVAAYPLTLTSLGFAVSGRGTRAHTAAILGGATLCAWACSTFFSWASRKHREYLAVFALAAFFTLLMAFGVSVQRDYVLGWQEQRGFWTDFVRLCPDLSEGDVVLVEPTGLRDTRQLLFLRKVLYGVPDTRQIKSLDFLFNVLPALYRFPAGWTSPPSIYRLPLDWKHEIFAGNGELRTITTEQIFFPVRTVPGSKVIFLETRDGQLTRRTGLMLVDGKTLQLKQPAAVSAQLEASPVFPYLILPEGQKPPMYLVK